MALPLPRVVADVGPGGPLVTSMQGMNALTQSNAQAQYAPYTAYADALSKIAYANMLPYQIQATMLSNPMLWMAMKDNPQALQGMMNSFAQSVPRDVNNLPGGVKLPSPGPMSNGLLGMLVNKLTGGSKPSSSNALTQPSDFGANNRATDQEVANVANGLNLDGTPRTSSASPLVPATGGGMSGVQGKMTGQYYGENHKPGETFVDPNTGALVSSPTNETRTAAQNAINAAKRVEPQLQKLADAAGPFLSAGGMIKNQAQRGWNLVFPNKAGDLPTKYAEFQSLLQSAPEALVKSYGLRPTNETIERMQKVIEPYVGETKEQYKNRIVNQLESLRREQVGVSQQQLGAGFPINDNNPTAQALQNSPSAQQEGIAEVNLNPQAKNTQPGVPTEDDIAFTAKKYGMTTKEVKKLLGLK